MILKVDPGFKRLIPPLSDEEYAQLETNIIQDGCREPIVTWRGFIVDGHNRYEICTKHGIGFDTLTMTLDDREAVEDWMDRNQLGRRNLSPDSFRLILGRIYNRTKKTAHGRSDRDFWGGQNDPPKTADKLAAQHSVSPRTVRRAGKLAEAAEKAIEAEPEIVAKGEKEILKKAKEIQAEETPKKNYRAQGTGENEWYTPEWIAKLAKVAMGGIDLDPASSESANSVVGATKIYTKDDDGLSKEWEGNVWLNPPYSRELMPKFIEKLIQEYNLGSVRQAIVLSHNNTDTKWFQSLCSVAGAVCFPSKRIRFYRDDDLASPVNGQVFVYLGGGVESFCKEFSSFGLILVPYE